MGIPHLHNKINIMCKTQLFNTVLQIVAKETEIPESLIVSHSRSAAVVDARSILVKILTENGIYPVQIAEYIHHTPSGVRNLITGYDIRKKNNRLIAIMSQKIHKFLESNY